MIKTAIVVVIFFFLVRGNLIGDVLKCIFLGIPRIAKVLSVEQEIKTPILTFPIWRGEGHIIKRGHLYE